MAQGLNYDKGRFKNDQDYLRFLDEKKKSLISRIVNTPQLLNVFIRLKDR